MAKRRPSTLERDEKEKETARVPEGTRSAPDSHGRRGNGGGDSPPPIGASEPPPGLSHTEFYARVARRAYDLFERRGREEGRDVEDWLEAERLVRDELLQNSDTIVS